jgi:hypothetical protein
MTDVNIVTNLTHPKLEVQHGAWVSLHHRTIRTDKTFIYVIIRAPHAGDGYHLVNPVTGNTFKSDPLPKLEDFEKYIDITVYSYNVAKSANITLNF